jgi:hypothetical protein
MALVAVIVGLLALLSALSYLFSTKEQKAQYANSDGEWFWFIVIGASAAAFPFLFYYGAKIYSFIASWF